jgi:hypothetical protein
MATSKVFVSPGVYTSESELSFVAQSVGVTTLGIPGETLKGPAFEPIFVTNYDEFIAYFGDTSPEKFVNTQIPKYELAYIAKAYLQQSNQLFVSRVLGLSGYDAGPSWSIKTIANVNTATIGISGSPITFTLPFTATTAGTYTYQQASAGFSGTPMNPDFTASYTKFNGSNSSYQSDLNAFIASIVSTNSLSGTSSDFWGPIPSANFNTVTSTFSSVTNSFGLTQLSLSAVTYSDSKNDVWYYASFDPTTGENYSGYSFYAVMGSNFGTNVTGTFTGTVSGSYYTFTGTSYSGYNEIVVTTLRSRGITEYTSTSNGPTYQVTGLSDVNMVCTGAYSGITKNPFNTFLISGSQFNSKAFSFEVSMDSTQSNFIPRVLGTGNFSKERADIPLFVEESYPTTLTWAYNKGYIRGLSCTLEDLPRANTYLSTSIANYLERYQTAYSPWIVSELRGNTLYQLFRYITISDGDAANKEVKVSFANMSFTNNTFDVLVRDFNDTDSNPVVLEKYTNCSMDPSQNNYIAKKIGSQDGQYAIVSKRIMVEVNPDAPVDSLPSR